MPKYSTDVVRAMMHSVRCTMCGMPAGIVDGRVRITHMSDCRRGRRMSKIQAQPDYETTAA